MDNDYNQMKGQRDAYKTRVAELGTERDVALGRVTDLEKTCDELYYGLRMSEDVGVEESFFDEDERGTGPDGLYPKLEERWAAQNPGLAEDESKEGGA